MSEDANENDDRGPGATSERLKAVLDSVWRQAINLHDLGKGLLGEDQGLDDGKTIVPASALPHSALRAAKCDELPTVDDEAPTPDLPQSEKSALRTVTEDGPPEAGGGEPDSDPPRAVPRKVRSERVLDIRSGEKLSKSAYRRSILPRRTGAAMALVGATKELATTIGPNVTVREKVVANAKQGDSAQRPVFEADYELLGLLGEGGMGVVYNARQTSIDREIALKVINPELAQDKDVQANLLAEAAVTGELEHPNIVPIYEMGIQEGGLLFYSMKKTKGQPWDLAIKSMSEEENIEVLMKACDAVAYAHSKGIIHRDLKPENISLGDYGEVLVMDWGLAVSVVEGGKIGMLTEDNAFGGTPGYMSPEMVVGDVQLLGTRSDVYLLGAILFEILTGKRPHAGDKARELLTNIAMNEIVSTDREDELIGIAMKAMATEPADRFETVPDFQKAVREALRHTESFVLTRKAGESLASAIEKRAYEEFSQALFGFQEALNMWDGNAEAREGERETRLAYTSAALVKGDLDLAESLIAQMDPPPVRQCEELERLRAEGRARQFRFKVLKYASMALVAIIIIGLTVSYLLVEGKRKEAETARKDALNQRNRAERGEKKALSAKAEVERAKGDLERQHELTVKAKDEADHQRKKAVDAKDEAESQRKKALDAKDDAENQRVKAEKAKEEALRQKREALKAKEEAERQRRNADTQREIAQKQRRLAEDSLAKLQRIGELKTRIKRSLTPEESKAAQLESARRAGLEVFKTIHLGEVLLDLALIPEGEFVMGSDISELDRVGEEYLHVVKFAQPFYMGRKEVTQAQWVAVVGKPLEKDGAPIAAAGLPITNVSFNQFAKEFLPKLNGLAPKGFVFRIPTEAEWEYACRSGSYAEFQSGTSKDLGEVAWFRANSDMSTHAVGLKKPNAWGLFDMHGNVTEMCADYYARNFYLTSETENPLNEAISDYRIARGGSWISLPRHCRSAYRSYIFPGNQYKYMGFRLVMARGERPAPKEQPLPRR